MKRLQVDLGDRSYPVLVGRGILGHAGRLLAKLGFDTPPLVVTNAVVLRLYGRTLLESLEDTFGRVPVVRIGDGEGFKNHATLMKIHEALIRARADRRSWVVAFGGGVVGDVAGFAAATYMRGIPYVGIPTTLLAQVDSSVGGKVAINVKQGKNLIGAFHQPAAVLSDTGTLRTLADREMASGLAEIIKCGAIRSRPLLKYLEGRLGAVLSCDSPEIEHVIVEAARIKAEVVSTDEREANARMILNFGHTLGHALEAATAYRRFKHGEAVAWGMIAAARLACELTAFPREEEERLESLIRRMKYLPDLRGISLPRLWAALQRDKKSQGNKTRMVLLRRLGQPEIIDGMDPRFLRHFIADFCRSAANPPDLRDA